MVLVLCEKFGHLNLTFSIGEQISSNGVILIAMTSMAPRGGKAARRVLPCWVERRPEHVTDMCWVAGRFLALLTVHQRIMGKNGLKKDDVGDLKIIFVGSPVIPVYLWFHVGNGLEVSVCQY
uniref:Uncharacterized protein n=1 Tax=Triticum urartu TaxID=4572 RepID=A0A8R7VEV8_TRIUA